ncbi:GNAT family N-acetyltransferase [Geosporobacter ferrireducens]|uniref:Alanine acetyltransferase n=1 Tax=Geosporobacter ferrireducens TaxID=1424294 RepID=A0A1D8GJY9_9FIRM|nr:GNAT family protein [Geosporobacter ferrireducens]AOT71227.1 alanine acetyltransferase [Geosporobacter ferrireducens]MTI58046.1 GNAT family N-acetyltransferase [Geosporobacter ferrireducens]
MFKYIVDKDLELKMLDINHAEALYDLTDACRLYLRKWLPWVDDTKSVEDTKAFIEMTKKQFASNHGFQAGIWYKQNLAGVIGYHKVDWANKSTSIGYWLGKDYQGNGIMIRATKAFVEYALTELNLNRVEIRCAEKNYKSRAIPERLGFTNEGISRETEWLYDHYVNHVIYGMLASQWKGVRSIS